MAWKAVNKPYLETSPIAWSMLRGMSKLELMLVHGAPGIFLSKGSFHVSDPPCHFLYLDNITPLMIPGP
jgi:hypothetical protein